MESYPGTVEPPATSEDLARIADELLEHTRALRRQHEELRDALAGISAVAPPEPLERHGEPAGADDHGPTHEALHPMVLQMALAGETREFAREQLHSLEVEDADALVDDVFDRVESQRPQQRKGLFARKAH